MLTRYRSLIQPASARRLAGFRAFSHHLAENVLVKSQIRYDPLQTSVLVASLAQLFELRHRQIAVLLLPHVEARLTDDQLAANVSDRCAALRLARRTADLPFRKPRPLHVLVSPVGGLEKAA